MVENTSLLFQVVHMCMCYRNAYARVLRRRIPERTSVPLTEVFSACAAPLSTLLGTPEGRGGGGGGGGFGDKKCQNCIPGTSDSHCVTGRWEKIGARVTMVDARRRRTARGQHDPTSAAPRNVQWLKKHQNYQPLFWSLARGVPKRCWLSRGTHCRLG